MALLCKLIVQTINYASNPTEGWDMCGGLQGCDMVLYSAPIITEHAYINSMPQGENMIL